MGRQKGPEAGVGVECDREQGGSVAGAGQWEVTVREETRRNGKPVVKAMLTSVRALVWVLNERGGL